MFDPVQYEIVEICKIARVKCTWRQDHLDDANIGEIYRNLFLYKMS